MATVAGLTAAQLAAGAAVAGATISAYSAYEQGQAADDAAKAKKRQAERQRVREVRQQVRENRMRRAQVANAAAQTGVGDSSLEVGTQGRLQSQLGGNLGTIEQNSQTQRSLFAAQEDMQRAQTIGAFGGLLQSAGSAGFQLSGGFGGNTTTTKTTLPNNPGPRQTPWGGR